MRMHGRSERTCCAGPFRILTEAVSLQSVDFYALRYCNMFFGMRLDWLGTVVVLAVVLSIVLLRNFSTGLDVSLAGLALASTNGLTLFLSSISMCVGARVSMPLNADLVLSGGLFVNTVQEPG